MSVRLRHHSPSQEGGFSLPELLVTITLMSIVSAAIIASTVAVQRNLGTANATMNDLATNRITIERVGALLRGAVPAVGVLDDETSALLVALPGRVRFHSVTGVDPAANPVRVELSVEGGDLVERIWPPTPALVSQLAVDAEPAYTGAPRQRVIGRDLLSTGVFTYWSHVEDGSTTGRCGRVLASPTGTQLPLVDAVGYRLQVQQPTGYESAPSDLQGWARFASDVDLGVSTGPISAPCLETRSFGYQDAYEATAP